MRYVYDTEFIEDGTTIELISIGVVREDGAEFYAVNRDAPWRRIARHAWLRDNVGRHLPMIHGDRRLQVSHRKNPLALDFDHPAMRSVGRIGTDLMTFFGDDSEVELWADYGAYDHVVLMQIFGSMLDKPAGLPMFTNDLQQLLTAVVQPAQPLPAEPSDSHNALSDAWHLLATIHAVLGTQAPVRTR